MYVDVVMIMSKVSKEFFSFMKYTHTPVGIRHAKL
jgi:hypothetical protein